MEDKPRVSRLTAGLDKPEREYLKRIANLLAATRVDAAAVGDILPDAVQYRRRQDALLAKSMVNTVEDALDESVRQDSSVMSNVLFPVIGSAIRKAIRQFMQQTMSRVNSGLGSALSLKRLGWRFQSWRTKTPYFELVLRNTLQARVEQVFLIHKMTSLLISSAVTEQSLVRDDDMVSSMLTAVRDFARDSMQAEGADSLDSFQMGEYTVVIVDGRHAILAAIVWGEPGQSIHDRLADRLETIEVSFRDELEGFTGDTGALAGTAAPLESCLMAENRSSGRKRPVVAAVIVVAVVAGLAYLLSTQITFAVHLRRYVDQLEETSGIVVTRVDSGWRSADVHGLRDPLGPDPETLLLQADLQEDRVRLRFDAYFSSDPDIVIQRAARILGATDGAGVSLDGGTLTIGRALDSPAAVAILRLLPGVAEVVVDSSPSAELLGLSESLSSIALLFDGGSGQIAGVDPASVQTVVSLATSLYSAAVAAGLQVGFRVVGRASGPTNDPEAIEVSQLRSDSVASLLFANGIPPTAVVSEGAGITAAIGRGSSADPELNRSVTVFAEFD